jgi:hypothetical protein
LQPISGCPEPEQTSHPHEPFTTSDIPRKIGVKPFEQASLLQNQRNRIRPAGAHLSDNKTHLLLTS